MSRDKSPSGEHSSVSKKRVSQVKSIKTVESYLGLRMSFV